MKKGKTVVRGLRASEEFFDKCDLIAKSEGIDRNKLIIGLVSEYLDKFEWLEVANLCDSKKCWIFGKKDE